jgi:hypothetical protein
MRKLTLNLLYAMQMLAGILSTLASATLGFMILKSEPKLRTPLRRMLFCLSLSDIFQSMSSVIGPIATPAVPKVEEQYAYLFLKLGNQQTCDLQGFMIMFGSTSCAIYTLGLCIYYLSVIKFSKSDKDFSTDIERKFHVIGFMFSFGTSIFYVANGLYNSLPDGNMCFAIESPSGCIDDPDVECVRGSQARELVLYITFIPIMIICAAIQTSLLLIYLFVKADGDRQERRFSMSLMAQPVNRNRNQGLPIGSKKIGDEQKDEETDDRNCQDERDEEHIESIVAKIMRNTRESIIVRSSSRNKSNRSSTASSYVPRAQRRARAMQRQIMQTAFLYVAAYVLVYSIPLLTYFLWYRRGKDQPIAITIIAHTLYPLQGLLNIFVFTRNNVSNLRSRYPEISWCLGLWLVIRAGGCIPAKYQRRRRGRAGALGVEIPVRLE